MKAWVVSALLMIVFAAAQEPLSAVTQRFRCIPVRPGDTAAEIARRLTGDDLNRQASWFQIFDAQRRLVSKRRYDDIRVGWHACIAEAWRAAAPARDRPVVEAAEATVGVEDTPARAPEIPPSVVEDPVLWWLVSFGLGAASVAL